MGGRASRSVVGAVDVRAYLRGCDRDTLVDLVLEAALRDEHLAVRLELDAGRASLTGTDPAVSVAAYERLVDAAFSTDGFVPYREAYGYSGQLLEMVAGLRALLEAGHAGATVELAEHAVQRLGEALGFVDDSDGWMRGVGEELGALHLDACAAARPGPIALAGQLLAAELHGDDLEIFYGAAARYAGVLGKAGLAEYRRLAEEEWSTLAPLAPGGHGSWDGRRFRLTSIMESLAEAEGDVDGLVEVLARDLSGPYRFVQIADRLSAAGRSGDAFGWLEKGVATFGAGADVRLDEALAEEYHRAGRSAEAVGLFWQAYRAAPAPVTYERLRQQAERAGAWTLRRDEAYAVLRKVVEQRMRADKTARRPSWSSAADGSDLVSVLLAEDRPEEAWAEANGRGCSDALWLNLAARRQDEHPDDAIPLWQRAIERAIERKNNDGYAEAVRLMAHVGKLMTAAGRQGDLAPYAAGVRVRHKPKRNLMKLLDQQTW